MKEMPGRDTPEGKQLRNVRRIGRDFRDLNARMTPGEAKAPQIDQTSLEKARGYALQVQAPKKLDEIKTAKPRRGVDLILLGEEWSRAASAGWEKGRKTMEHIGQQIEEFVRKL